MNYEKEMAEQIKILKAQGYSNAEINQALSNDSQQMETPQSMFSYNPDDNLIKWQLELNDILERAEHILREDIPEFKNGNIQWKINPDKKRRIFNDYGVKEIMRILSMYVNRNTILSDYEPKEIKDIVFDFGIELNNLIFMKYENFGLTDLEKRKNYPMLVRQIVDMIHSTYNRAKYGREKTSLRTARQIQQTENVSPFSSGYNVPQQPQERSMLNPMRYIGGKFK